MISLSYEGNILSVNKKQIECSQNIKEAFVVDDVVVVLLDPDAKTDKKKKYKNLLAYNANARCVWVADLPNSRMANDAYWKVQSKVPLLVSTFSSYDCEIDLRSGKIKESVFYK